MFAQTLVNAKNLTLADRQAIKEYLEPYVKAFTDIVREKISFKLFELLLLPSIFPCVTFFIICSHRLAQAGTRPAI